MSSTRDTERIRSLNDVFRSTGSPALGTWVATAGIAAQGPEFALRAIALVQAFDSFTPDNDPHGEHDFGSFQIEGQTLYWKIDYYDPSLTYGSEDPSDAEKSRRVLTIMFASEY